MMLDRHAGPAQKSTFGGLLDDNHLVSISAGELLAGAVSTVDWHDVRLARTANAGSEPETAPTRTSAA